MARRRREDAPGMWHHVFNRGLANRTVFESIEIVRFFLSRVALAVRRDEIEVHAYALMTTHFHLLVRSVSGQLSVALQRIESEFVRWFNRVYGRDGALFRGRFGSRPVKSLGYRQLLVRYIDQNPVVAGLVPAAENWPHGSATHYLGDSVPPWLTRSWIDDDLRYWTDRGIAWTSAYRMAYSGRTLTKDELFVLERRMTSPPMTSAFDDLIAGAPEAMRIRFAQATQNADRTKPGWPIVGPEAVAKALADARQEDPVWTLRHAGAEAWRIAEAGLLRELCGMKFVELSQRLGRGESTVRRTVFRHKDLLARDAAYATRFAEIATRCIAHHSSASARR